MEAEEAKGVVKAVYAEEAVNLVEAVEAVEAIGAVYTVEAIDAVDAVGAVEAVEAVKAVKAEEAVEAVKAVEAVEVVEVQGTSTETSLIYLKAAFGTAAALAGNQKCGHCCGPDRCISVKKTDKCLRPYHLECTSSRLITEVKQG